MYSTRPTAMHRSARLMVPALIAAFLLALSAERPQPVSAAGATSQTIVALVNHVAGLTAKLTTAERQAPPRDSPPTSPSSSRTPPERRAPTTRG